MSTTIKASLKRLNDNQVEWEVYGTTDLEQLHVFMSVQTDLYPHQVDSHSSYQNEYTGRGIIEVPGNIRIPWHAKAIGYPGDQMATLNEILETGEIFSSGSETVK
ncbi:MAG: hypothetical protein PHE73_06575 [Sulfurovaceae bacterium]|nr:hypothetical protein [Sulfurovaceae bacterium]